MLPPEPGRSNAAPARIELVTTCPDAIGFARIRAAASLSAHLLLSRDREGAVLETALLLSAAGAHSRLGLMNPRLRDFSTNVPAPASLRVILP